MKEVLANFKNVIDILQTSDYVFLIMIITLMVLTVILVYSFKKADAALEWDKKEDVVDNDILSIVESLEACDERINIDLTEYEKGEEEASIISYEELLKHTNNRKINYEEEYKYDDLSVKKIGLSYCDEPEEIVLKEPQMSLNYEKEEALLNALKQLQNNLSKSH